MSNLTFRIVALPHTNVNNDHPSCAFNAKTWKFARMMKSLGHRVVLYSSENYDEECCDEHFLCITEEERVASLEGKHYTQASFDYTLPHWKKFNENAIMWLRQDIQPQDFICVIGGLAHKEIADAFPNHMTVEFGIGYSGTFAKYRVFESYAWMHTVYGQQQGAQSAQGIWFDEVIPSYFDMDDFPFSDKKDDYYLYVGRLVPDKGYRIAQEVCEKMGKRLILAGPGEQSGYGEFVGEVDAKKRGELMSKAKALFCPSTYLEPFGSVAVEAQLCGTPVISTDWGAFTETVEEGQTGFRCRSFSDFMVAVEMVELDILNRRKIRARAESLYSMSSVAISYHQYFDKLLTLWDKGWYA